MKKITLSLILFLLFVAISFYIKKQIDSYNMDYYSGKDNGAFAQFESICLFAILYYFLLSQKSRLLNSLLGLFLAIIISIIMYIIFGTNILFPLSTVAILIGLLFIIQQINRSKSGSS